MINWPPVWRRWCARRAWSQISVGWHLRLCAAGQTNGKVNLAHFQKLWGWCDDRNDSRRANLFSWIPKLLRRTNLCCIQVKWGKKLFMNCSVIHGPQWNNTYKNTTEEWYHAATQVKCDRDRCYRQMFYSVYWSSAVNSSEPDHRWLLSNISTTMLGWAKPIRTQIHTHTLSSRLIGSRAYRSCLQVMFPIRLKVQWPEKHVVRVDSSRLSEVYVCLYLPKIHKFPSRDRQPAPMRAKIRGLGFATPGLDRQREVDI